jgi:hypothetical protein
MLVVSSLPSVPKQRIKANEINMLSVYAGPLTQLLNWSPIFTNLVFGIKSMRTCNTLAHNLH